jgi:serine/threonine protein kinase
MIVHNDVKPDNWIISDGVVKMCDFGFATRLQTKDQILMEPCGTAPYMSPEMLNGKGYSMATDLFAVGVIAYLFFYGSFPYLATNAKGMRRAIKEGETLPTYQPATDSIATVSAEAAAFCKALLNRDPKQRASADEALALPLLKGLETMAQDLPSLRPAIDAAARAGCFGRQSKAPSDPLDVLLESTFPSKKVNGGSDTSTEASTLASTL